MRIRAALVTLALASAGTLALAPAAHAAGTSYTWTGAGNDGLWTTAANWSPAGVPGNGDSALIQSTPSGGCATQVDAAPTATLQNLTVQDVTIGGNRCVSRITSGGTLSVAGDLQFHGQEIDVPVVIRPGATGTISPSSDPTAADASRLGANLTVQGHLTLANNVSTSTADHSLLFAGAGVKIVVASGGTLTATGTNHVEALTCCVNPSGVVNDGTLDVSGTLQFDATELDQNAALVTHATTDSVTSYFAPNTAANGATWTGPGLYRVTYASASDTLTGTQTLGSGFRFVLGGGVNPDGNLPDGNESLHGTFTFKGAGRFFWQGGHVAANATIAHGTPVILPADLAGDARTIDDLDTPVNGGTAHAAKVSNHGTVTVNTGATVTWTGNSRLLNQSDGVLSLAPGSTFAGNCCDTAGAVVNTGLVGVAAGSATVVTFDGVGYQATGGTLSIPAGKTVTLVGGAASQLYSTTVSGGGTFDVRNPVHLSQTVTIGSATKLALGHDARLEDVVVNGTTPETATIAGPGSVVWNAGALSGNLNVATAGGLTVSGTAESHQVATSTTGDRPAVVTVSAPTTVTAGTSTDVPNRIAIDAGTGLLTLTGPSSFAGYTEVYGGRFVNRGTLTAALGAGKRFYDRNGTFANYGAVKVTSGSVQLDNDYSQAAGGTAISSGAEVRELGSSAVFRIAGGTLSGTGAVRGPVTNGSGVVAPGGVGTVGTLAILGRYTQGASGSLRIDVASASRDVLSVHSTVSLKGTLAVNNLYPPAASNVWAVVVATSTVTNALTCTITTGTASTGTGARHWVPSVSGNNLVVKSAAGSRTTC